MKGESLPEDCFKFRFDRLIKRLTGADLDRLLVVVHVVVYAKARMRHGDEVSHALVGQLSPRLSSAVSQSLHSHGACRALKQE